MYPYIKIFGRVIFTYPLMAAVGALAAGALACVAAKGYGKQKQDDVIVLLLFSAVGAYLGGSALYAAVNLPALVNVFSASGNAFEILRGLLTVFSGSVFYGGLIGGIIAGAVYLKKTNRDFAEYSDIVTPSIPLFHAFGRLGCFFGGCCYGVESKVGFIFRRSLISEANGLRRLPVQLIEASFLFLLCAALTYIRRNNAARGKLIYIYMTAYGIFRFIIEYWRGDQYRGFLLGLSTSQWISLAILAVCAVRYISGSITSRANKSRRIPPTL